MTATWDRDWGWQTTRHQKQQCDGPESLFATRGGERRAPAAGPEAQVESNLAVSWSTAEESARTALLSLGYSPDRIPVGGWRITARSINPGSNARVYIALDMGQTQEQTTMTIKVTWAQDPQDVAEGLQQAIEREASQRQPFDFQTVNPINVTPQLSRGEVLLQQAAPVTDAPRPPPPRSSFAQQQQRGIQRQPSVLFRTLARARESGWCGNGPIYCDR